MDSAVSKGSEGSNGNNRHFICIDIGSIVIEIASGGFAIFAERKIQSSDERIPWRDSLRFGDP